MPGYASSKFRHKCDVHDCYLASLTNWDDIIACFPRNIRPTDIDGMVEIGGRFLFLEEKGKGVGPDEGQRRALKALSKNPLVTVAFFRPGKDSDLQVLIYDNNPAQGWKPCARNQFLTWLSDWSASADRREECTTYPWMTESSPSRPLAATSTSARQPSVATANTTSSSSLTVTSCSPQSRLSRSRGSSSTNPA